MRRAQGTGKESALPEMTAVAFGPIPPRGIFGVHGLEYFGQGFDAFRNSDQMDMVGHQGIAEKSQITWGAAREDFQV
jgi:hypothetical protein